MTARAQRAAGRIHELKTDPEVFQAAWDGRKTFEICFDPFIEPTDRSERAIPAPRAQRHDAAVEYRTSRAESPPCA